MERLGLIAIILSLHIGCISAVRILATSAKDRISDDFIVVLNYNQTDCEDGIKQFVAHMKNVSTNAVHTDTYTMGSFVALRVTIQDNFINHLGSHPDIKYIEANQKIHAAAPIASPDNPLGECKVQKPGAALWGLSRISSHEIPSYSSSKYTYLTQDGEGVDVYVLDTGVYAEHSEFEGRAKTVFAAMAIKSEGLTDLQGHGTHVSGTIAGKTYGVAKKANILGVKVLNKAGIGTTADLIEGLEWVYNDYTNKKTANGQRTKGVVNLSLGGSPMETETLDEAAITMITEAGLPFIVAAGNDNFDACSVSPARLSIAVTVGATNSRDDMPTYSNFGPCVDILAPGDVITSSYIGSPTSKALLSGTSMATPHVTGVVARFMSQMFLAPTPAAVKAWLVDTATKGKVTTGPHQSTPNRLLYMDCIAAGVGSFRDSNWFFGNGGIGEQNNQRFFVVFIALCALIGICILSIILLGVALRHIGKLRNQVTEAQEHEARARLRNYQAVHGYNNPNYYQAPSYPTTSYPTASYPTAPSETSRLLS